MRPTWNMIPDCSAENEYLPISDLVPPITHNPFIENYKHRVLWVRPSAAVADTLVVKNVIFKNIDSKLFELSFPFQESRNTTSVALIH